MVKYPKVNDNNFYQKINDSFKEFKIPKKNPTMDELCNPKKFKLTLSQEFVASFLSPSTPYKGILVNHKIGSGKTCTAIQIGEKWKNHKKIIVVLPASLKENFRSELRTQCAKDHYITMEERNLLKTLSPNSKEYKDIIEKSNKKIDKFYKIYSYHKFVELIDGNKLTLKNSLLIIDEIQNMISENGHFYNTLHDIIKDSSNQLRIVLLSATPMFDKPDEIALTMNLLDLENPLPIGHDFYQKFVTTKIEKNRLVQSAKNIDEFKKHLKGYVSYFRGAPPVAYPEIKIKYVKCEMSHYQYNIYKNISEHEKIVMQKKNINMIDLPNNFYIGTRLSSNIVFPNGKTGEKGIESLTSDMVLNKLEKYSCKFAIMMNKINHEKGKIFVFSNFKEYGGIYSIEYILKCFGYKNFLTDGEGKKRYAIWSGDESTTIKEKIRTFYNRKDNLHGEKIKILLGSPSIKEGVSLTAVKQVHIIDPYWNKSRLDQVIGRANRYCSHKDLDEDERKVMVYLYIAIAPLSKQIETIDQFITNLSIGKDKLIKEFEKAIKESAVDCYLNKNANEPEIVCDK